MFVSESRSGSHRCWCRFFGGGKNTDGTTNTEKIESVRCSVTALQLHLGLPYSPDNDMTRRLLDLRPMTERLSLADAEAVSQHTERPVTQHSRRSVGSRHSRRRKSDGDNGGFLPSVSPFHRSPAETAPSSTGFAGGNTTLFSSNTQEEPEEQVALDEYDPAAAAAREEKKLRDRVMALRDENNRVTLELQKTRQTVEETRGKLEQVKAEDEILQIRKRSQARLAEEIRQVEELQEEVEREERYSLTLEHMYRCRREERVERLKAMQAVEEALRVQEHERELQENHAQQVQAAVKAEEGELRRIAAEQRRQQQDLKSAWDYTTTDGCDRGCIIVRPLSVCLSAPWWGLCRESGGARARSAFTAPKEARAAATSA